MAHTSMKTRVELSVVALGDGAILGTHWPARQDNWQMPGSVSSPVFLKNSNNNVDKD